MQTVILDLMPSLHLPLVGLVAIGARDRDAGLGPGEEQPELGDLVEQLGVAVVIAARRQDLPGQAHFSHLEDRPSLPRSREQGSGLDDQAIPDGALLYSSSSAV